MISPLQKDLFAYVDRHLFSYLDEWRYLHTHGYTLPTQNIQEFSLFCWQKYGFQARYLDHKRTVLYAESTPTSPQSGSDQVSSTSTPHTILLFANIPHDAPPDNAFVYPFLASLAAFSCYQALPGMPELTLKWLLMPQTEEGADNHSTLTHMLQTKEYIDLNTDGCILYTLQSELATKMPVPQLILGTKGILQVTLTHQTAQQPIRASYGAVAPNAAWQLLWAIASLKDKREDILIDGFYDQLIAFEDKALASLDTLPEGASVVPEQWGIDQLVAGLQGRQRHYAYFLTPTCTVTDLHSPAPHTQVPGDADILPSTAQAMLDFRLVPDQDPHTIFIQLQQYLTNHGYHQLHARLRKAQPCAISSTREPLFQSAQQAMQAAYQEEPVIIPLGAAIPSFPPLLNQLTSATLAVVPPDSGMRPASTAPEIFAPHFARFVKGLAGIFANSTHSTPTY